MSDLIVFFSQNPSINKCYETSDGELHTDLMKAKIHCDANDLRKTATEHDRWPVESEAMKIAMNKSTR